MSSTLPLVARTEGPSRGGARTAGRTREEHRGLCEEIDGGYIATGLWVTRMSRLPKLSELHTGDLDILPNVSGAEKINPGKQANSPSGSSARWQGESRL